MNDEQEDDGEFFRPPEIKETPAEIARKTGLAFASGAAFFGSVVVLTGLGYLADRFFGSSPTGLVSGIILGAIIGFIQFFRLTSQIIKK
jgi:F0F1-type ATP synthase assembly protein I